MMKRMIVAATSACALLAALLLNAAPAQAALTYLYAEAYQTGLSETSATALLDPEAPPVATGDFHSLGEIAVRSTSGQQVVEIGWTVDKGLYGDSKPRLFIAHWVNGVFTCYTKTTSLCGFVLYSGRTAGNDPGQDLTSAIGTPTQFGIIHFSGAWWVSYGPSYIGSFPDSLWSGASPPATFTTFGEFKGYGEVAANVASPCTDMGKGTLPVASPPAGAGVTSVTYSSGSAGVNLTIAANPNPTKFNALLSSGSVRSMRYGGPGWC